MTDRFKSAVCLALVFAVTLFVLTGCGRAETPTSAWQTDDVTETVEKEQGSEPVFDTEDFSGIYIETDTTESAVITETTETETAEIETTETETTEIVTTETETTEIVTTETVTTETETTETETAETVTTETETTETETTETETTETETTETETTETVTTEIVTTETETAETETTETETTETETTETETTEIVTTETVTTEIVTTETETTETETTETVTTETETTETETTETETTETETTETETLPALERYESDYFYSYLSGLEQGASYLEIYRAIDSAANDFHMGRSAATEISVGDSVFHYFAIIEYASYGFTVNEASSVMQLYLYDHPLYYWFSGSFIYTSDSIFLCVIEDYLSASVREEYNSQIYSGIADIAAQVEGINSAYELTLAYHDIIISLVDYAYEDDGVTPQDDPWAHNIIGLFDGGRGMVCEGYADAFSLLLNFSGVENILVPGRTEDALHIWNLVELDDGEWYWYDVTWDDDPNSEWGIEYQFFCVSETADVYRMFCDGGYTVSSSATFTELHSIEWLGINGPDMSGALPDRATDDYESDGLTLRETFTVDNFTYAKSGYNTVQLVAVLGGSTAEIPESVIWDGVEYTVISVGGIGADGVYSGESVLPASVTEVKIPSTVKYIWRGAFSSSDLKTVTIASDNGGIVIGEGAFSGCSRLSSLTLCKNVRAIGTDAFSGCVMLFKITFEGTLLEWDEIDLRDGWSNGMLYTKVNCTDGSLRA